MNNETLKALKGSIAKWQCIVDGVIVNEGIDNCPLCQLFFDPFIDCCSGCPVFEKTNYFICLNTPYRFYVRAVNKSERIIQAKSERDFLISLLPKKR